MKVLLLKTSAKSKYDTILTLLWWRPLSYRNQSIDLLCKSMDWSLYNMITASVIKELKIQERFVIIWKCYKLVKHFRKKGNVVSGKMVQTLLACRIFTVFNNAQNVSIGGEFMNHEQTFTPISKFTECLQSP